jgi:hypothetical protein
MMIIEPKADPGAFKKSFQPVINAVRLASSITIVEIDRKAGAPTIAIIKENTIASNKSHIKSKSMPLLTIEGATALIGTRTITSNCNGITATNTVVIPTRAKLKTFERTILRDSLKGEKSPLAWL